LAIAARSHRKGTGKLTVSTRHSVLHKEPPSVEPQTTGVEWNMVLASESMIIVPVPAKFKRLTAAIAGLIIVPLCPSAKSPIPVSLLGESFSENQEDAAETHLQRGLQQAKAGDLPSAQEELRAAVRLQPNNAEFLSSLATVLAMQKKFAESSALFEKVLKINPDDLRSREYLAANLWQLRRYAEAKENLTLLLKANPADAVAKLLLGMVSEKTGDYATAVTTLEAVPDALREQPEVIVALAKSYYRTGERDKAAACLRQLASRGGENEGMLLGVQIAAEMQDYSVAEILLSKIPENSSNSYTARYYLAVARFQARQYEESERILQQLLSAGQKNGKILRLLGWCYHYRNREDDAIATFREAVQLDPNDQANFLDLGAVLMA
jgi:cytochrome c-type biogenesis protein CcmH/NrfG